MIKVGFIISFDPGWLGGINYFRNLLTALYDDPARHIEVVLFMGRHADPDQLKGFPKLEIIQSSIFDRRSLAGIACRLIRKLTQRDFVLDRFLVRHRVDVLSHSVVLGKGAKTPVISWIPDFQHLHLPALFSPQQIAERNHWFERQCQASEIVVLSSEDAQRDLYRLFPWAASKSEVLQFVPDINLLEKNPGIDEIEQRYGFTGPYIYLPNQYWAHKNHLVVIEALALLKQSGKSVRVISTGSPSDYRHPNHYADFCKRIDVLGIGDAYLALGVIPYRDLLALMRHSVCLINPSLFEGWSSTVEEAKALGKHIILSDIPVHREQNPRQSDFFPPTDAQALTQILWHRWQEYAEKTETVVDDEVLLKEHRARRIRFSQRYHQIATRAANKPVVLASLQHQQN